MNDYSTNYYKQSSYKQKLYDNYPTFPSNVYGLDTTKNKITMQICFLRVCSFVRSPRARHLPLHSTYPEVSHPLPSLLGVRFLMWRAGLQNRGQVRSGPPFEFNSSDPCQGLRWLACACPESGSQTGVCELPSPPSEFEVN